MRRRDFIALVGAAAGWPPVPHPQQQPAPVIGFLHSASAAGASKNVDGFRQGLREMGYVEGQNVAIEYRWAENRIEQLPALAADLVQRRVSAIVAAGASMGTLAIKSLTSTIPIIFLIGSDPIAEGLVASLNPRSGNITGSTFYSSHLGPKRLELLHELVPAATSFALLANPDLVNITRTEVIPVIAAARALGIPIQVVDARAERDFETAFATLIQERVGALIICTAVLFNN